MDTPEAIAASYLQRHASIDIGGALSRGWELVRDHMLVLCGATVLGWLITVGLAFVPILGWINASWRGMPISMFGTELPQLVATRAPGWRWTGDVHALLSNYLMLTLVGLHVLAALYHYFIRRDQVLQRMLPGRQ